MVSSSLLDSAIDQFGLLGFEGASTREIARASGTAMSSITYHFGGKHGLYLAAADHIAQGIAAMQADGLGIARAAVGGDRDKATEALLALLDSLALMMLRPESEAWSRFVIREQQQPTEAFDRLFRGAMAPIVEAGIALLGTARPDLAGAAMRATGILLFGQAIVLRAGHASVCRILGVDSIDEPTATLLRTRLRANALAILSETP